jgi:murein DD-endopeptidase MepM/ murein hydrolase activator NlpD
VAEGRNAQIELPVGEHRVRLTVTDASGATDTTDIMVIVVDQRPAQFALAAQVNGPGRTEPPAGTSTLIELESTVTVTAIADAGARFTGWSGDSSSTEGSIRVSMNGPKNLTANFEPIPASDTVQFHLPWGLGETRFVGQANNGEFSHQSEDGPRFAWDFTVNIGTPVLAVAAGRVIKVIEDIPNNAEGAEPDPDATANAVQIDHGNGLQSLYAHLDQFGVAVEPGQLVARGQYLGRSGNSGYATGPHLHYEVLNAAGRSSSTGFAESLAAGGIAEEGDRVTSQNSLDVGSVDGFIDSTLAGDVFTGNNVELFEPTPPAFYYATQQTYSVGGRVTDGATSVCLALVDPESGDTDFCEPQEVNADGTFEFDFNFPAGLAGSYLMGVVSGTDRVRGLAPVTVFLVDPPAANNPPVVQVQQPAEASIAFGGGGFLIGSGSDADGDALTYLWSQTCGPEAVIADPTAAETTFSLPVELGHTRVAFQLIASDGTEFSRPAEVVFQMDDNFAVQEMGALNEECSSLNACMAATTGELSATGRYVVWVTTINVNEGDRLAFEIRDPTGQTALTGYLCEPVQTSLVSSLWRYGWTSSNITAMPGTWQAVFLRNGKVAGTYPFTLEP